MTIFSKKTDQSGRSMVEMLGVLAIIGVLSVGGISGYSKAMAKFKLTKAQDQITMLLMNIRTAYATSPSYKDLSESTAADYNLAPNEMVGTSGSDTVLYGTFGGRVEVGEATTNTYFYIRMYSLGKEACRSLASSDWGADGLVGMIVSKSGGNKTYLTADLPVTLSKVTSDKICSGETSDITWVYY